MDTYIIVLLVMAYVLIGAVVSSWFCIAFTQSSSYRVDRLLTTLAWPVIAILLVYAFVYTQLYARK